MDGPVFPGICTAAEAMGARNATVTLALDSDDSCVGDALDQFDQALTLAGLAPDTVLSTRIVLAEVINNIVEHAYGRQDSGLIKVQAFARPDGLACEVRDTGAKMPDGPLPGASYPTLDPDKPLSWPEGGFGWAIVRDLTDCLCYTRQDTENVLRFRVVPDNW